MTSDPAPEDRRDAIPRASIRVAAVQFGPTDDTRANAERMRALARDAADRGARLVVFPEYTHYFRAPMDRSWVEAAEPLDGPFAASVRDSAHELGVHIVAGMLERAADGTRFTNTLVAFAPSGELVATYRKLHLYDAFGQRESDFAAAGTPESMPEVFEVDGMTVGLQTCYDLRFPEVTRRLVDAGAEVVLVPSEWVPGPLKLGHWSTLLAARAIENTAFVVAADHPAPSGVGGSVILDPAGVELAALGDAEDIAVGTLDPARLAEVRRVNPALQLRRFRVVPGAPD